MLACVYSCAVIGLDGVVVEVEVDTADGLPGMAIVGPINLCPPVRPSHFPPVWVVLT